MYYSYGLMDLGAYGRQEAWEDSPASWPRGRSNTRTDAGSPAWTPVSTWPGGRPYHAGLERSGSLAFDGGESMIAPLQVQVSPYAPSIGIIPEAPPNKTAQSAGG